MHANTGGDILQEYQSWLAYSLFMYEQHENSIHGNVLEMLAENANWNG